MTYDFRARSDAALIFNTEPSRTKQEFATQCDINNILKKYTRNGVNPFIITADAKFGDFSDIPSYQEALDLVNNAADQFMTLPALLRRRFNNDPAELLNFLGDNSNREEAIKLGLIPQPPVQPIVEPGASKAPSGD
jgi:phage internal scaffolding protein